ncbi:hypothetical protein SUDANB70_00956 [Streptomyces sp. enrichment culture]
MTEGTTETLAAHGGEQRADGVPGGRVAGQHRDQLPLLGGHTGAGHRRLGVRAARRADVRLQAP